MQLQQNLLGGSLMRHTAKTISIQTDDSALDISPLSLSTRNTFIVNSQRETKDKFDIGKIVVKHYVNMIPLMDLKQVDKVRPLYLSLMNEKQRPNTARATAMTKQFSFDQLDLRDHYEHQSEPSTGPFFLLTNKDNQEIVLDQIENIENAGETNLSFSFKKLGSEMETEISKIHFNMDESVLIFDEEEALKINEKDNNTEKNPEKSTETGEKGSEFSNIQINQNVEQYLGHIRSKVKSLREKFAFSSFTDDLVVLDMIKKGVSSEIHRAFDKGRQIYLSVKIAHVKSIKILALIQNELEIIEKILNEGNSGLITIYDIDFVEDKQENGEPNYTYTITTELGIGTLRDYLQYYSSEHTAKKFKESTLLAISSSLLTQYLLLKNLKIFNRDISPENIIIASDLKTLKLFDFGQSISCEHDKWRKDLAGTPMFMAPEVFNLFKKVKTSKYLPYLSDLYSIAMVLSYIFNYSPGIDMKREQLNEEPGIQGFIEHNPKLWSNMMKYLLQADPQIREQVFSNPMNLLFFSDEFKMNHKHLILKILAKLVQNEKESHMKFEAFLPFLTKLEDFDLIKDIFSQIMEQYQNESNSYRNIKNFLEKLIRIYNTANKWEEEIHIYKTLADVICKLKKEHEPYLSEIYRKIARIYTSKGIVSKALENLEKALYIDMHKSENHQQFIIRSNLEISKLYSNLNLYNLSLDHLNRAKEIHDKLYPSDENLLEKARICEQIASLYITNNKFQEAQEEYAKSLEYYNICFGPFDIEVARCHFEIGKLYQLQGDYQKAFTEFKAYSKIKQDLRGEFDIDLGTMMHSIGDSLESMGLGAQAIECYSKAVHILDYFGNDEAILALHSKIAKIHFRAKEYSAAAKNIEICSQIYKIIQGEDSSGSAEFIEQLGDYNSMEGESVKAIQEYSKVLKILTSSPEKKEKISEVLKKIAKISPLAYSEYRTQQKKNSANAANPKSSHRRNSSIHALIKKTGRSSLEQGEYEQFPVIICSEGLQNIRGVLDHIDFEEKLGLIRRKIEKQCPYLVGDKFEFLDPESLSIEKEKESLINCRQIVRRIEGFNYLMIKEQNIKKIDCSLYFISLYFQYFVIYIL